mmetsp:Transcript_21380/g.46373  ORF Transcript_21380/g.46373 Transcript_21380/m.46373 type:complete len:258 (+) Transcript_21380:739-1512(+)
MRRALTGLHLPHRTRPRSSLRQTSISWHLSQRKDDEPNRGRFSSSTGAKSESEEPHPNCYPRNLPAHPKRVDRRFRSRRSCHWLGFGDRKSWVYQWQQRYRQSSFEALSIGALSPACCSSTECSKILRQGGLNLPHCRESARSVVENQNQSKFSASVSTGDAREREARRPLQSTNQPELGWGTKFEMALSLSFLGDAWSGPRSRKMQCWSSIEWSLFQRQLLPVVLSQHKVQSLFYWNLSMRLARSTLHESQAEVSK